MMDACQKEMRTAFLGGFAGQLVSGLIWLGAAAVSDFFGAGRGMVFLFVGCMGIFPLTQGVLKILGRPARVSADNKLWALGSQVAFTVPLNFLLVGAIVLYRPIWFFPAAMIVVGTHYLPFITLYGMKMYGFLAGLLIAGGAGLALYGPEIFSVGAWLAGGLMLIFAAAGRAIVLAEERSELK